MNEVINLSEMQKFLLDFEVIPVVISERLSGCVCHLYATIG